MKKTQHFINNLHEGRFLQNQQNQNPYYVNQMQNFAIDNFNNLKKRVGSNLVTRFNSNETILQIKLAKLYNYNVILLFTKNKLLLLKENQGSYLNATKLEFNTPWQNKEQVQSCGFVEHGNRIYIFSMQGSYILEDFQGNVALNIFEFYDGPWHSRNDNRKHYLYAEARSGATYIKSQANIFESFMQGYYMQVITPNTHCGSAKILQYISPTVIKVEATNLFARTWSNNWTLGGFILDNNNTKPIRALIKDGRLFLAYSNLVKGNVVVSVSYLNEFSRFSVNEKVGEIATSPVTELYSYTEKSGYYYEINDAKEVSFLIETGSCLALGTDNGVFNLSIDNNFKTDTKRKTEFSKLNNANVTGSVDYSDLNSIFVIDQSNTNVLLCEKNTKYEKTILNSKACFEDTSLLSDICYVKKPYRMLFMLKDNYEILCASCNFNKTDYFAWQNFLFCANTYDSSYLKIHTITLNKTRDKLYLIIEREEGVKNIETLNLNNFQHNELSTEFYLDACTKVYQNQDGVVENLASYIGHKITIIGDGNVVDSLILQDNNLKLNKVYENVFIGYAYNCFIDVCLKQENNKKRIDGLALNFVAKSNCFVSFAPFLSYVEFTKNTNNFMCIANNYSPNKTIRVTHTSPSNFSLQSISVKVSTVSF